MSEPKTIDQKEALALLAECFNMARDAITPETEREAIEDWDSMGALMLMAELDERFGLELTADTSRGMTRISHALDFLRSAGVLLDNR